MENTKITKILEYLGLSLILSYFFVHNIFLVLAGIIFAVYQININFINSLVRPLNKDLVISKESCESIEVDKDTKSSFSNLESYKSDSNLTLVEKIEEFGFIPSIDENNDIDAA